MVVFCKVPYGDITRWCREQGYTELPLGLYNQNDRPLLIVDNRINTRCHDVYIDSFRDTTRYIKQAKGRNIYFGLREDAIEYIGVPSLVVWSKK